MRSQIKENHILTFNQCYVYINYMLQRQICVVLMVRGTWVLFSAYQIRDLEQITLTPSELSVPIN